MRKEVLILIGAFFVIAGSFYAYVALASRVATVSAHFVLPDGSETQKYELEIAADTPSRRKGLMYRTENDLPPNSGMIFIFPRQEVQSFWMKNTLIPLDMIFVDRDMKVVGVVESAVPRSEQSRSVSRPSTYVVELHGGTTKRDKIGVGATLKIEGSLPEAD